jgi:hypothetical protein
LVAVVELDDVLAVVLVLESVDEALEVVLELLVESVLLELLVESVLLELLVESVLLELLVESVLLEVDEDDDDDGRHCE